MSKRGVPPIRPDDLREPATEDRIERIWERIESDLALGEPAARWRASRLALGVAAVVAASFCFGVVAGRHVWRDRAGAAAPLSAASGDPITLIEVLAAGTQGRTFPLPGGGQIALSPGATVEIAHRSGAALSLRLVQGEAAVDIAAVPLERAVSILAGDATLATHAGSVLRVRHTGDAVDVAVTDGSVQITSPSGTRRLGRGERADAVPIRASVATAPTVAARGPVPMGLYVREEPLAGDARAPIAAAPDWRVQANAGELGPAFDLLRRQPGGVDGAIGSARTAAELMEIHDVAQSGGDPAAAMRALSRIVDAFPGDAYAQLAAFKLGNAYKTMGQSDKAQAYFERARRFQGALAEDALCKQMRTSNKNDALRMAREYLGKYPDGRCKDDAERIAGGEDPLGEDDQAAVPDAGAETAAAPAPAPGPAKP
jgi:hypothetical protein